MLNILNLNYSIIYITFSMIEYIIYQIKPEQENLTNEVLYVGSTKNLKQRKKRHKEDSRNEFNKLKLYLHIRENGGFSNFDLFPIEILLCKDKIDARIREQYWINQFNTTLNSIRAYRSPEEYQEYCESRNQYQKGYNSKNKENVKEYQHKYYEKTKERFNKTCICSLCNKEFKYSQKQKQLISPEHLEKNKIENK